MELFKSPGFSVPVAWKQHRRIYVNNLLDPQGISIQPKQKKKLSAYSIGFLCYIISSDI